MHHPALRVRDVSKCYRLGATTRTGRSLTEMAGDALRRLAGRGPQPAPFWALRGVSLDVASGDMLGVVGRNGAGKSTLLKILTRITTPTAGRVELYGRVGSLLEVGTGFHAELSGRENIFLNGSILGMSRKEVRRHFGEIVEFAGVEEFLDTPVKRYSSGMYVRLAFAVAAHLQPDILIVDEVLAVGDAQFQQKCLAKMREASRGGRTVLFVSHNLGTVRSLCRTAVWLSAGQVEMAGDAGPVTDAYLRATTSGVGTADLDAVRDRYGSGGVRLLTLSVNGGGAVMHGEPLAVTVGYRAVRGCGGVSFGFGISDASGVRLLSADTDHAGPRRDLFAGATGEITLTLPALPLHPGTYLLDLDCRSGPVHSLEYLAAVAVVEVVPGPTTRAFVARGRGGVQLPAAADWRPEPAEAQVLSSGLYTRIPTPKELL